MANIEQYQGSIDRYRKQEPVLPTVPMHRVQPSSQMMDMMVRYQELQAKRLQLQEQQQMVQMLELMQAGEQTAMMQMQRPVMQQYAPQVQQQPVQSESGYQPSFNWNGLLWGFVAAFALLAVCMATENSRNGVGYQPASNEVEQL